MSRSDQQRVEDILEAAQQVAEIVAFGRSRFDEDSVLLRAAERLLEIIGEAASNLSDDFIQRYPQVEWPYIRRLRNLLAHHYHRVDAEQVWQISSRSVPALAAVLEVTA